MDIFFFFFFLGGGGVTTKLNSSYMTLLCILGSFLMVNVQSENILAWQKFQIFFGVLEIPDFWRQTVYAGPNPTYEEKVVHSV